MGSMLCSMLAARFAVRIVAPLTAIAFKWILIGKYQPGTYPTIEIDGRITTFAGGLLIKAF
ncbi:hypothetical protein MPER_01355, partial [Moniliophthora perniciosa FA553]